MNEDGIYNISVYYTAGRGEIFHLSVDPEVEQYCSQICVKYDDNFYSLSYCFGLSPRLSFAWTSSLLWPTIFS